MSNERKPATRESLQDCKQPHHLHGCVAGGKEQDFAHMDQSQVSCDEFVRMISNPPVRGKPCHFASKRDHMLHEAKWGRHEVYRHLAAGLGAHPQTGEHHIDALARHDANEAAALAMPAMYHCSYCGEVFEPKGYPQNEHVLIFCKTIVLPGGKFLTPDHTPDGQVMELIRAICPRCVGKTRFVETAEHDWNKSDHLGKTLS